MADAHFHERDAARPGGAEGPAHTTRLFSGKVLIAPDDAPKWAAATRGGFKPPANPLASAPAACAMTQAEYDGARWYDPAPLFGRASGGYMAITADGSAVFVYQVDR